MPRRSASVRATSAGAGHVPSGRALPFATGGVLVVGLGAYAWYLTLGSFTEVAAVVGLAGALVATVLSLTRSTAPRGTGTFPLPVRAGPPVAPRPDSAFVCAKCDTYAAPPDWEALLREFEPARDLEGHGREKPWFTPGGADSEAVWPRWPIPAEAAAPAVAASAADPSIPGRWVPTGWNLERAPSLLPSTAALDDDTVLDSLPAPAWGVSGGFGSLGGARSADALAAVEADSRLGPSSPVPPAPPLIAAAPSSLGARPSLEQWISEESAGIIALLPRSEVGRSFEREPRSSRHACVYCRTPVEDLPTASRCTDCRRPVCGPCEESLLDHGGDRYCSPCAINRLGSDLLRTIEEPVALGGAGAYARSGARRTRPRRRAPRTRAPAEAPAPGPAPLVAPALPAPPTPSPVAPESPSELATKGIPDPVL